MPIQNRPHQRRIGISWKSIQKAIEDLTRYLSIVAQFPLNAHLVVEAFVARQKAFFLRILKLLQPQVHIARKAKKQCYRLQIHRGFVEEAIRHADRQLSVVKIRMVLQ